MERTIRLALTLTLLLAVPARAGQPVRVRELPGSDQQAERVRITSPYVRLELQPRLGFMTLMRVSPAQPRPESLGTVHYLDHTDQRQPAGYLVHRHTDGSVTVALTARGGAGRETRYLHVPVNAAVVTLRTVVENRGVSAINATTGIGLRPTSEKAEWLAGGKRFTPHAEGFAGWYDASRSLNLVVVADSDRTWSAVERRHGRSSLRVSSDDWTDPPTLGSLQQRTDDLYLLPVRGVGRVTEATPHVALAAARVAGGWRFGVHPMRALHNGKLTAHVEQLNYRQTVNADPHRPAFVDVPLAEDRFTLRIADARGRAWLNTDLGGGRRADTDVRRVSDETTTRAGRHDASQAFTAALAAIKDRNATQALERLEPLRGGDRATGSLVVLLHAIALLENGRRDEATRMLRDHAEREPGLIEAWLLIGDTSRVRKLTRYDKRAWSDAQATLMALQAGRWPTR